KAGRTGAVMHETAAAFAASDPAASGDPRTLNMPYVIDDNCMASCTFTRTLKSVASTDVDYVVSVAQPAAGVQVAVSPTSFTLHAADTQTLTVTVTIDDDLVVPGAWAYGSISIEPAPVVVL